MKARIRKVRSNDVSYDSLMFVCPGCVAGGPDGYAGLHMLPVNAPKELGRPSWNWDGNLEAPTLEPSILSNGSIGGSDARDDVGKPIYSRCHAYLRAGVFEFLSDSEHPLAGQKVPIPDLPEWAERLA